MSGNDKAELIHLKTMLVGANFVIDKLLIKLKHYGVYTGIGLQQQIDEFKKDMQPYIDAYAKRQEAMFEEINKMIPEEVADMEKALIEEGVPAHRAIQLAWQFYNMFQKQSVDVFPSDPNFL